MELWLRNISCCLVTRGGYDISDVVDNLSNYFSDIVIYNNKKEPNLSVFGRYEAIKRARYNNIYTQDDDCIVQNVLELAHEYNKGNVCSMTKHHSEFYNGTNIKLLGWGSIFNRKDIDFKPYLDKYTKDNLFLDECDRIFTNSVKFNVVERDIIQVERPKAMSKEDNHYKNLEIIKQRICPNFT